MVTPMTDEERQRAKERAMANKERSSEAADWRSQSDEMTDENNPYFLIGAMLGEKSGEVTDLRRRIKELEAKLAKLRTFLDELWDSQGYDARELHDLLKELDGVSDA